jgi:SnoaL-like domain
LSRLGPWQPATLEERVDRLESLASIRQLAVRYALALDSRDMSSLVGLFPTDVRVGRDSSGREALRQWFTEVMSEPRTSVHLVANHIVDFDDADSARGIVYCRDQLERPATGRWDVGDLQYWDTYRRIDGEWFFHRRKFHRWYMVDALDRPTVGAGIDDATDALTTSRLPEAFETWASFWSSRAD